ncbi:hypothetical protein D3C78_18690 [compost metagenome]
MESRHWIDNGNGRVKGRATNGRQARILSMVGTGFTRKHSMPTGTSTDGFLPTDQLHVGIRDLNSSSPIVQEYFVGTLARNESKDGERIFNTGELDDNRIAVAIATMSALLNPYNTPVGCLSLGLPLGLYHENSARVQRSMEGLNMEVQFRSGSEATQKILVRPQEIKLFPQCGAGIFAALFNKDGSLRNPNTSGLYAGVDIGWGTTDFIVLEVMPNGSTQVRGDMTDTIEVGLANVIDSVRSTLENQYGSVNRNEFENSLLKDPGNVFFKGQQFDMRELLEHTRNQVAQTIINAIRRKWSDKSNYIRETFLFGGGAADLAVPLTANFHTSTTITDVPDITNLDGFEIMDLMSLTN